MKWILIHVYPWLVFCSSVNKLFVEKIEMAITNYEAVKRAFKGLMHVFECD
jgi:hypothetical protein